MTDVRGTLLDDFAGLAEQRRRRVARAQRRDLCTISFTFGVLGAFLGVLALVISAIGIPMPPPPNSNTGYTAAIRIVSTVVAGAFVVGVLATIGAAVLPARRATRREVAEALRHNI